MATMLNNGSRLFGFVWWKNINNSIPAIVLS